MKTPALAFNYEWSKDFKRAIKAAFPNHHIISHPCEFARARERGGVREFYIEVNEHFGAPGFRLGPEVRPEDRRAKPANEFRELCRKHGVKANRTWMLSRKIKIHRP